MFLYLKNLTLVKFIAQSSRDLWVKARRLYDGIQRDYPRSLFWVEMIICSATVATYLFQIITFAQGVMTGEWVWFVIANVVAVAYPQWLATILVVLIVMRRMKIIQKKS